MLSFKPYQCTQCQTEQEQQTNHYGEIYITCPTCKTTTTWQCEESEHVAKMCQVPDCKEEATRWIADPNFPEETFFFCLEHEHTEQMEEDGEAENSASQTVEVAIYSCAETCATCNT